MSNVDENLHAVYFVLFLEWAEPYQGLPNQTSLLISALLMD
jgi:hypothetical protein